MRRVLGAAMVAVLLAGCQVSVNPPGRPTEPERERITEREMRQMCRDRADRQGLEVRRFGEFEHVTGSGGRLIGADIDMRVRRGGQNYNVVCAYTYAEDRVRIVRET
jgi:hypothetical protein